MPMRTNRKVVLVSAETDDGDRCVDIFRRPDGSFGFEAYRRDAEDGRGWFATGGFESVRYDTEFSARRAARENVRWIAWDELD
jgi:hypothetical protein